MRHGSKAALLSTWVLSMWDFNRLCITVMSPPDVCHMPRCSHWHRGIGVRSAPCRRPPALLPRRCHATSKQVTERKLRSRHAHAHAHETPEESKQMHTHMDTQPQKGELNREALRHLHQGQNEFLRGANAIECRQCTRLTLPSLAALGVFPCPLPPVRVHRLMHGQLSKTPLALGSRRRTSRPQPLGLLSSCPPFSSSPAPVGHGRAGVGCEQAHGSVGAGFHWCHWCRCLSACRPCASHACVSVGDFEIALWVRRRWG
jgi:hypothetical protein